jgi:hypothetical protein
VHADVLHLYKKERVIPMVDQQHSHHHDQFCHPPCMPLYTANLDQLALLQKSILHSPHHGYQHSQISLLFNESRLHAFYTQ